MAVAQAGGNDSRGGSCSQDGRQADTSIDSPSLDLLSSPLDFLYAEHLRQRQFAKLLGLIADGVINRRTIAAAAEFVENDLATHILDEEVSFFPLLRPLCQPEDRVDDLLALLSQEHREDEGESERVLSALARLSATEPPSDADKQTLRSFSDHLRGHLALENGVLLPLARSRMTSEALQLMSQSMSLRRNIKKS